MVNLDHVAQDKDTYYVALPRGLSTGVAQNKGYLALPWRAQVYAVGRMLSALSDRRAAFTLLMRI